MYRYLIKVEIRNDVDAWKEKKLLKMGGSRIRMLIFRVGT